MGRIKVKLVSIEDGITALGFRRIAAIARELNSETEIYFITPGNLYSFTTHLFPSRGHPFDKEDVQSIAKELAKADLVCFSTMTPSAVYVEEITNAIKKINPRCFILWGGTHCILNPNEAIEYVDAISTGEGEISFAQFYQAFTKGKSYLSTHGMWFKTKRKIKKNINCELNSVGILDSLPHPFWGLDCYIYNSKSKVFDQFTKFDYVRYNGLSYRTIWCLGCPFSCTYCANDAFISLDSNYRKLRYFSVNHLLDEIEIGRKLYPFISTIVFLDDNFIAIPLDIIKIFCEGYKKRINLPFAVMGLHPNLVTKEKIELLGQAGMNRGRIGIQSGSERMLAFYNRPTPIINIKKSAAIMATAVKKYHMIPTSYDIISDNPVETRNDLIKTLKLLYQLKRPYTLTIFSLRIFPRTKLYDYFKSHSAIDIRQITSSYLETQKTIYNIILYFLAITNPPKPVFKWLIKYVKPGHEGQRHYPILYAMTKAFYLSSRGLAHLRRLDFSTMVGPWGYYLWRLGIIQRQQKQWLSNR